jgi:hypothetical protein
MLNVSSETPDVPHGLTGRSFRFRFDRRRAGDDVSVFFALRDADAALLSATADAILPYAGIMALVEGVDLDLGGMEVDPVLLRGVRSALAETARLHGRLRVPRIEGAVEVPVTGAPAAETGVFFSGGVDSMFSALRHRGPGAADLARPVAPATTAIHIYHTDRPVEPSAFRTLDALSYTAGQLGLRFVPVQSNLMTACRSLHDRWADLGHGAGLATVLHMLSGGLGTGVIGSTHVWGGLVPWGSSPVIDPLWSGRRMTVIHDDASFGRVEKTSLIAGAPEALDSLNVCDIRIEGKGYENCSACPKCLRTMVTLDLFGAGGEAAAPSFDWSAYEPGRFAHVFLRTDNERAFATEILDAARARGRADIVAACERALWRGRVLRPLARAENAVKASPLGIKYRRALKSQRDRAYRVMGWATKRA